MNSINSKSIIKTLNSYLSSYKDIFYERSFKNFTMIIMAMLSIQEVRSIKFLYEKFIKKHWDCCLNRFYYFLADKNFSISKLALATLRIGLSIIPMEIKDTVSIYLIVDDTLQSKFGECFDCYYKLFDHTQKSGSSFINGHCFVSLAIAIPVLFKGNLRYIKIPLQYKLYDKSKSKMALAADMVLSVASELKEYQVIVVCDSWYTKKPFVTPIRKFNNMHVIGAIRSDTAIYDLKPLPTGKRGRPRLSGQRIDYKTLQYQKDCEYFVSHLKALINLVDEEVYITVTTTDISKFSSVRLYVSTINPNCIKSFDPTPTKTSENSNPLDKTIYNIYKIRWNVEVIFYQQKTFWSLSKYMVRSKESIDTYVNLLGVAYSTVVLLPFINSNLSQYKFSSPQEIKYSISESLTHELIYDKLLKKLQLKKNTVTVEDIFEFLEDADKAI